ncbi:hypothetical protein LTR94_027219, partial [Friedmanniomyces endolithicus]
MIDRRRLLFASAALGAALSAPNLAFAATEPQDATAPGAALTALLDRMMQEFLAQSPEFMTSLGMDVGPNAAARSKLDDRSQSFVDQTFEAFRGYQRELAAIDRSTLMGMDAVNYDTTRFFLEGAALSDRFDYGSQSAVGGGSPYVVSQLTGSYMQLPQFLDTQHPIREASDAEAYLERLSAFAGALDVETERTRADYAKGATPPDFILRRTGEQFAAMLNVPPETSDLTQSLVRRTAEKGLAGDWQARAEAIVRDNVYPALRRQAETISGALANASSEAGCWRLPEGEAYYRYG